MKKTGLLLFTFILIVRISYGQACSSDNSGSYNASGCGWTSPQAGDFTITVKTGDTFIFDIDMVFTGSVTIKLVGSTSNVFIPDNISVTFANLVFSGSATGKVLEVEGDTDTSGSGGELIVTGVLDFGGNTIEIDGEGDINAGEITGGENVSCEGTGTCPTFVVDVCNDASGLCTEAALPIILASFDVSSNSKSVTINWTTASEENNDYFTIERSADGRSFHELAIVSGAGTSYEILDYSYSDNNPFQGVSYYRLKQTDYDGTNETFKVAAVEFYGKSDAIKVIQSGNMNELKVYSNLDEENKATIYDAMGRISKTFILQQGENNFDLSAFSNKSGIYILRVTNVLGKELKTERFVIK